MRDFNHTISVLVIAYLNNTLKHGTCYACAVGNIVADGIGTKVITDNSVFGNLKWANNEPYPAKIHQGIDQDGWGALFSTDVSFETGKKEQIINKQYLYSERVNRHINATGYDWIELAKIEKAFEGAKGKTEDDYMFNGLMAVVDVLADIHGINLQHKEEAKALFVKH